MSAARAFLAALSRFEKIACALAFVVMAGAPVADVLMREITGSGILGAPQVGVIGMIAVAMFGFGIAAQSGGQLRPRFLDGVFPKAWGPSLDRIADLVTALGFAVIGVLAVVMTRESAAMGDVTSVLRWPIWPMQAIIAVAFLTNTLRYLVFFAFPALRPGEDLEPETALKESPP
jgi:TRAP-type C4-dicarboxylate transport system permease small subunit